MEPTPLGPPLAWETRRGLDVQALLRTLGDFLLHPGESAARLQPQAPPGGALLYFLLLGGSTAALSALGRAFLRFLGLLGELGELGLGGFLGSSLGLLGTTVLFAVLGILAELAGLLLGALVVHGLLHLLGGARYRLVDSLRLLAYVDASLLPLALIPVVGRTFVLVLAALYQVLALARFHRCETWKAAVAVLLPGLLLGALLLLSSMLVGMAALIALLWATAST